MLSAPQRKVVHVYDAPDILCYEGVWNALVAVGIIGLITFCILPIVGVAYLVYILPTCLSTSKNFRSATKFITRKYRASQAWWTIVILLKGLWVNFTSVLFTSGIGQLMWLNIGLLIYASVSLYVLPWRHYLVSYADSVSHCMVVYIFSTTAFFVEVANSEARKVSVAVVGFVVLDGIILLSGVIFLVIRHYTPKSQAELQKDADDICNTFSRVGKQPERVMDLFQLLPGVEKSAFLWAYKIISRESLSDGFIACRMSSCRMYAKYLSQADLATQRRVSKMPDKQIRVSVDPPQKDNTEFQVVFV